MVAEMTTNFLPSLTDYQILLAVNIGFESVHEARTRRCRCWLMNCLKMSVF